MVNPKILFQLKTRSDLTNKDSNVVFNLSIYFKLRAYVDIEQIAIRHFLKYKYFKPIKTN